MIDEPKHIIVGYDGRDGGRDAFALGQLLVGATHEDLLVVQVMAGRPAEEDRHRRAEAIRAETGVPVAVQAIAGTVPGALHDVATKAGTTLVVGSSRRGPVGRVLLGEAGERLLHDAPCPIAVAPHGFAGTDSPSLRRIRVGYDGREPSRHALVAAGRLAVLAGASVELTAVVEPPSVDSLEPARMAVGALEGKAVEGPRHHELREALEAAKDSLPQGLEITAKLESGGAAEKLSEEGAGADLIVVGGRARSPRLLPGGVVRALIRHSPAPLLIVPPA